MSVVVRTARLEDAHAIARIHVDAWRVAYRGHMTDAFLDALSVEQRTASRRQHLEAPGTSRVWVLDEDSEMRGFSVTGPSRDDDASGAAELYAIYLAPEHWGRRLGEPLLAHSLEDLWADQFDSAMLWVLGANQGARRFYERAGFSLDGGQKTVEIGGAALRHLRYRVHRTT